MKARKLLKTLPILLLLLVLVACRRTSPSFNFGDYSEAERLYEKGKYREAIAKYEEYIRENPEGNMAVIASYYMAKSYEGLGETDEARQIYEKIKKGHPGLIWADFSKTRLEELASESA
jgi:TolA-binding protein